MLQELIALGFSQKEGRVYAALVELGETTIGPLEKRLGIHKQIVYTVLRKLQAQGVISTIDRNGRKHFSITDPDILRLRVESQKAAAESLIPKIYAEKGAQKQVSEIKMYDGGAAIQAFFIKMLKQMPRGGNLDILGALGNEFMKIIGRPGHFFDRYEHLRIEKNIFHRMLMYESQRATIDPVYVVRKYVESRYLSEHYIQPMATHVWPDRVSFLLPGDSPHIVEIKSSKITEGFRNYFAMLWKMGKK